MPTSTSFRPARGSPWRSLAIAPNRHGQSWYRRYIAAHAAPSSSAAAQPNINRETIMDRHATAVWKGTLTDGTGTITSQSGALDALPYTFKGRFQDESGKSGT